MREGELYVTLENVRAEEVNGKLRRLRRYVSIPRGWALRIKKVDDKHVYFGHVGRIYRLPIGWVTLHAEEVVATA